MNPKKLLPLALIMLAACSLPPKRYTHSGAPNLTVTLTAADSSRKVLGMLDIHRVSSGCETEFAGRVDINPGSQEISLPTDSQLLLAFVFVSGGAFKSTSAVSDETLFTAKAGYAYNAEMRYEDAIHSVEIVEHKLGSSNQSARKVALQKECSN